MDCFILKNIVHYGLHFIFPVVIAMLWSRQNWKTAYVILLLTMCVDIDHLLADPIFDPDRLSVGFHLLHTYPAIGLYAVVFILGKGYYRLAALGLLLHMFTDFQDGQWIC